jgi:hypothetical protein
MGGCQQPPNPLEVSSPHAAAHTGVHFCAQATSGTGYIHSLPLQMVSEHGAQSILSTSAHH